MALKGEVIMSKVLENLVPELREKVSGVLKVTDTIAFQAALRSGVGSTGKAFGFSLLSI